jgi:phosphatidylglycerol:prolipoprotein diacylglycerol transferase
MIPQPNIPSIQLYGPFVIHIFGILVAIGILVGARWTRTRGRQLGLVDENVAAMITSALVGGFLFAHIFDVIAYQRPEHFDFWEVINPFGGLSSFGGFSGALAGLFYWCYKKQQPVMPYADSLGYGLSIGWMFGRLGCFSAHDHPGRFTDFFLSVQYPDGARHDLGLDEALWAGLIAAIFFILARKPRPLGIYVTILTLAYAPVRFGLDFLRVADIAGADPRYLGLTPAQYGAIGVLAAGTRSGAAQELRRKPGAGRRRLRAGRGRAARPARPQRRRQDHRAQAAARHAAPDRRQRPGAGARLR